MIQYASASIASDVIAIHATAPGSVSDMYPVGGAVAGSAEASRIHQSFQEQRAIPESRLPLLRHLPRAERENLARQSLDTDPWQDQPHASEIAKHLSFIVMSGNDSTDMRGQPCIAYSRRPLDKLRHAAARPIAGRSSTACSPHAECSMKLLEGDSLGVV
jgi:hypothetical protein